MREIIASTPSANRNGRVWSGGVAVATLAAEQIIAAAQVAQERKAGE